ncbi:MAG: ABC transporter permease [Hyphomicrobiales bacterium]
MAERLQPGSGPLDYGSRTWLRSLFAIAILVLYLPILTLMAFSFNTDRRGVVWRGFTLNNYLKAWNNRELQEALINSLSIAVLATVISTVIGAMLAILLWRFRFPGKAGYEGLMALPIVIPEICMGVALALFFANTGMMEGVVPLPWPINLANIIIAHVAFCFPFVAIVVRSRLVGFNREFEEASKDLGANEWQTFWNVLVPFMMPGLVAGALLAFTLSLDDFVITFFTSGPDTVTFPVKVYSLVRRGVSPEINAASTVLIIITILATTIAMKLQAPAKAAEGGT